MVSVFTSELLEATWKQIQEFERDHFGLKFGEDFPVIAKILQANKHFMSLGGVTTLLASLEMSGMAREMKGADETVKRSLVDSIMTRPSSIHNTLAELFYLGYELGCRSSQIVELEKLTEARTDVGQGPVLHS